MVMKNRQSTYKKQQPKIPLKFLDKSSLWPVMKTEQIEEKRKKKT